MTKKNLILFSIFSFLLIGSLDLILNFSGMNTFADLTGYYFVLMPKEDVEKLKALSNLSEIFNTPETEPEQSDKHHTWPNQKIGTGSFNISSPSGYSEKGQEVFIFYDKNLFEHSIGYSARDLDGTHLTYIYINDTLVDKKQISLGSDGSLGIQTNKVSPGEYTARAVQYDNNEENGSIIFYQEQKFYIK